MRVGLIGLGIMGSGMGANLLAKGQHLTVWNRTASRTAALASRGAEVADSIAALTRASDVVLVCVSDTPDVEAVLRGGVIEALGTGKVVVDHSTISPSATVALAAEVAATGAAFLDAPVSGGAEGAARGTLSIMVGGDPGVLEQVRPVLSAYSTTITHLGNAGSGQFAKLVNQVLVVVNQMAVSEALLFASVAGLDLATVIEAVKGGAGGSWMLANRGPQMAAGDWRPGFTIDLQQKDLRLVLEEADRLGLPLPATSLVFQLYRGLQAQGLGGEGNHALVKALERLAGRTLD